MSIPKLHLDGGDVFLLLTIKSGRKTPIAEIPTPDLAVP